MAAVAGPQTVVEETIRIARGEIKRINKTRPPGKKISLPELKDSDIHRAYPRIKQLVLENLVCIKGMNGQPRDDVKIFAVYIKAQDAAGKKQADIYRALTLELTKRIVKHATDNEIDIQFDVYFDHYGEQHFREGLYEEIKYMFPDKKISLTHVSSHGVKAIQVADVVTGTVRRYVSGEDLNSLQVFRNNLQVIESIEME